jgi:hypothetical protein
VVGEVLAGQAACTDIRPPRKGAPHDQHRASSSP